MADKSVRNLKGPLQGSTPWQGLPYCHKDQQLHISALIPSGPGDLLSLKLSLGSRTSSLVTSISSAPWTPSSVSDTGTSPISFTVKTDEKNYSLRFSLSAMTLFSSNKRCTPLASNGPTFSLSDLLLLMYIFVVDIFSTKSLKFILTA